MAFFATVFIILVMSYFEGLINIAKIKNSHGEPLWQINPLDSLVPIFDRESYTANFFIFFTTQTNILICFSLLGLAFAGTRFNNRFYISKNFLIAVSVYASLTMFVFWFFLIPSQIPFIPFVWFKQIVLHFIGPMSIIYASLKFFVISEPTPIRQYCKKTLWKIYFYPIVYLILVLIRGEFRYLANKPKETQYPYFFFHIHEANPISESGISGSIWLLIMSILGIIILTGFSILYNSLFNIIWKKRNKI